MFDNRNYLLVFDLKNWQKFSLEIQTFFMVWTFEQIVNFVNRFWLGFTNLNLDF